VAEKKIININQEKKIYKLLIQMTINNSDIEIEVSNQDVVVLNLQKPKSEVNSLSNLTNYNNALKEVRYLLDETNISLINLPSILKSVMEVVDNIPMSGADKKIYAIKIVREIIDEKTYGEEEAVLLLLIDNGTIANMIDLIIDATRGNLNINAIGNTVGSCTTTCIPYIFKKIKKNK